jgi:hypothetical protein
MKKKEKVIKEKTYCDGCGAFIHDEPPPNPLDEIYEECEICHKGDWCSDCLREIELDIDDLNDKTLCCPLCFEKSIPLLEDIKNLKKEIRVIYDKIGGFATQVLVSLSQKN